MKKLFKPLLLVSLLALGGLLTATSHNPSTNNVEFKSRAPKSRPLGSWQTLDNPPPPLSPSEILEEQLLAA